MVRDGCKTMLSPYVWILYLHIGSVFGFLFMHGPSAAAAFAMRRTRDPARLEALVDISKFWVRASFVFLLLIIISGIGLGFMGNWWGKVWIWLSIAIFLALMVLMHIRGTRKFYGVRRALGQEYLQGWFTILPGTGVLAEPNELNWRLRAIRPWELTVTSVVLLAVLLALMLFKPF